jgi:murein DD-endopeptidase MepM/ murein hydrolase activator NlpD
MSDAAKSRRILSDRRARSARRGVAGRLSRVSPGQWIALFVLAGSAAAALGIAPDTTLDLPPPRLVAQPLPLPDIAPAALEAPLWREERVQRGDTIGSLLTRAGVTDAAAVAWLSTNTAARPLYRLPIGRPLRVAMDDEGRLAALRFVTGDGDVLSIGRDGERFTAMSAPPQIEIRHAMRAGVIESSLFAAADDAGLPDSVTLALAEVFGGDIDFLHDLRRGDRFTVVYETRHVEGEPVGAGRILAAEFENRGTRLRAFLWRDDAGEEGYYTDDGRSSRKAFLRTPVEFSRLTSGFSLARFHPILQRWRAHKGVDYAAPVGTAVRATGDGVVAFAGVQSGYGNVVIVQHGAQYATVYAHLSRFTVRTGARVRQGETIGHVGATGWATGPHLHYEFRVGGEARNPLTLALPTALPVPAAQRAAFAAEVAPLRQQLALAQRLPGSALLASE